MVGDTTYRALVGRVEVSPLGPLDLKGKGQPVNAFRLERLLDVPVSVQGEDG